MPVTMRQLAWVQVCTWFGLFCMWLYFPVAVAHDVFGAPDESSPIYQAGIEWGGLCFAMYSAVCFVFSFFLPALAAKLGRRNTHTLCLLCGAAGLLSVALIHDKYALLVSMTGVGIAWASILSMPYAILAGSLPPQRTGAFGSQPPLNLASASRIQSNRAKPDLISLTLRLLSTCVNVPAIWALVRPCADAVDGWLVAPPPS